MGRGYSSFHRRQGPDQARAEQVERSGRNDPGMAERKARARAGARAEVERRIGLLGNFAIGDKVTDGRYIGCVKGLDALRGDVVVDLLPIGKEVRWSPDFVSKIP